MAVAVVASAVVVLVLLLPTMMMRRTLLKLAMVTSVKSTCSAFNQYASCLLPTKGQEDPVWLLLMLLLLLMGLVLGV